MTTYNPLIIQFGENLQSMSQPVTSERQDPWAPVIRGTNVYVEQKGQMVGMDIDSFLLTKRVVSVPNSISPFVAEEFVKKIMFLNFQDPKSPITILIDSPGGMIDSGLKMYDAMQASNAPISTIVNGIAASMGSVLLAAGHPGSRFATPNARVMIHQPSGGAQGKSHDIELAAADIVRTRNKMNQIYEKHSGLVDAAEFERLCRQDTWLNASEAKALGLIDDIIDSFTSNKMDVTVDPAKQFLRQPVPIVLEVGEPVRETLERMAAKQAQAPSL